MNELDFEYEGMSYILEWETRNDSYDDEFGTVVKQHAVINKIKYIDQNNEEFTIYAWGVHPSVLEAMEEAVDKAFTKDNT